MSVLRITRVREIADLRHVAHWARRLPLFDSADRNRAGNVAITCRGRIVATIACANAALAYAVEMICTSVVIRREYAAAQIADNPIAHAA